MEKGGKWKKGGNAKRGGSLGKPLTNPTMCTITVVYGTEASYTTMHFKSLPPFWPWAGCVYSDAQVDFTVAPILNDISNTHPPMSALAMVIFHPPRPENMHREWAPHFKRAEAWFKENVTVVGYDWERPIDMKRSALTYII